MSKDTIIPVQDIMHYESEIWSIADLLLSASVKQSDFPAYMMPFFALTMLEGRMLNYAKKVEEEEGLTPENNPEDFEEAFLAKECGWNRFIVMEGKTLRKICMNDTTFEQDFHAYLNGFDADLKRLLGVGLGSIEQKFLNMDGIVAELRGKKILMQVVSKWAEIDLAPYTNSDITTLEEHIKRKWADISASTAGEQYTPDDIISLVAEIAAAKVSKPKDKIIHIYDPTCGGANMLFGVADRLHTHNGYKFVATYGSEYNDALYALAAIESRFREFSDISYGNTLTKVPFSDRKFDLIVANPPYGTKWSGYEKEVKNDQLGQFPAGLPSISDGQLLFMQHILWQLDACGLAIEVHNGSTLFSGDAGSGESNIRKYIFDHDWVEAIIQMPQQEFFNTGIYTYLWIMNKNKEESHRNKVALIDASSQWKPLKKSKGDKRREMVGEQRQQIVDALIQFENNDICKIYDREHFYYNKQTLTLTDLDEDGKSVVDTICKDGTVELNCDMVYFSACKSLINITEWPTEDAVAQIETLKLYNTDEVDCIYFNCGKEKYYYDKERETIVRVKGETEEALGKGQFVFKLKKNKKEGTSKLRLFIEPALYNDYEIIPFHFDEVANKAEIDAFMAKYIFKPFILGNDTVGVELNFNKEFYVPEELPSADTILADIEKLNEKLSKIKL